MAKRDTFTKEQLIETWNKSNSVIQAAELLSKLIKQEVRTSAVSSRAAYYRKLGEKLKPMPRGRRPVSS